MWVGLLDVSNFRACYVYIIYTFRSYFCSVFLLPLFVVIPEPPRGYSRASSWLFPSILVVIPEDRILEVNPEDNAAVRELPS